MIPIESGGGGLQQTPSTFGAINIGSLDADPDGSVGDIYYDTTSDHYKFLRNESGGFTWRILIDSVNLYTASFAPSQVTGTAITAADSQTVTTNLLANGAVSTSKLQTGSVTAAKLNATAYGASGDLAALSSSAAAGTSTLVARADHVHPTTGLATLGAANTFTVGGQIIKTGADANTGLQIWRNSATQTANLLTFFQSDGSTVLAKVDAAGKLTATIDGGSA